MSVVSRLQEACHHYYNTGQPIMSDTEYDSLLEQLRKEDPDNSFFEQIGCIPTRKKVKLPMGIRLGSMEKAKKWNVVDKWISKYRGPYVLSDKLDGCSAMVIYKKGRISVYSRGDGTVGQNITKLVRYLQLPKLDHDLIVRGEIILSKESWKNISMKHTQFKNARNTVSGQVNTDHPVDDIAKHMDFVAYEIINSDVNFLNQYRRLEKLGFITVQYKRTKELSEKDLKIYLQERGQHGKYEIDGIIVCDYSKVWNRESDINPHGNPRYAIAFKQNTFHSAVVKKVIWEESRHGRLVPRVELQNSVHLDGGDLTYFSGFNARFIKDKKIGPGAELLVTRSGKVIPFIAEVVKPAKEASMPTCDCRWKDGNDGKPLELYIKKDSKIMKIKRIEHFFSSVGVENFKYATIEKCYNNKLRTVHKLVRCDKDDLLKIDGIQEKTATRIVDGIRKALESVGLLEVMVGSGCFAGLARKKLQIVSDHYPDMYSLLSDVQSIYDRVIELDHFGSAGARTLSDNATKFMKFLSKFPTRYVSKWKKPAIKQTVGDQFKGQVVVFSGFRDKQLEQQIVQQGGKVTTSVSSKTTLLYTKKGQSGQKVQKAQELNIEIRYV